MRTCERAICGHIFLFGQRVVSVQMSVGTDESIFLFSLNCVSRFCSMSRRSFCKRHGKARPQQNYVGSGCIESADSSYMHSMHRIAKGDFMGVPLFVLFPSTHNFQYAEETSLPLCHPVTNPSPFETAGLQSIAGRLDTAPFLAADWAAARILQPDAPRKPPPKALSPPLVRARRSSHRRSRCSASGSSRCWTAARRSSTAATRRTTSSARTSCGRRTTRRWCALAP